MGDRLAGAFKERGKAPLFIPFLTVGNPDPQTCEEILLALPAAGADIVELGIPFSDPVADGPALQRAGQRGLENGANLQMVFSLCRQFRLAHPRIPLILMGYANPIYRRGYERFAADAADADADGVIAVDLPPEEDKPLAVALKGCGLAHIRLATPTTDEYRLRNILKGASGFLYYVAVAATTGSKTADTDSLRRVLLNLKKATSLPLAAGFGFKSGSAASALRGAADAIVVGSALAEAMEKAGGNPTNGSAIRDAAVAFVTKFSRELKR